MKAKLKTGRECVSHPGAKGDDSEIQWLEWFTAYLPKRYEARKAFVLDSKGNLSDQIDIVIFDRQYSPFLLHRDSAYYVPAESVYAVLEIKQSLNKDHMDYTNKKIKSVRSLYRTSARIPHAGGVYEPKKLMPILSGILTYDCDWSPSFGEPFKEALACIDEMGRIDVGCSICNGSFSARYGIDGSITVDIAEQGRALIFFFLELLSRLQDLGTVVAIDLREYMKVLSEGKIMISGR